jgi:sulfide:quinone oxidoreductase
VSIQLIEGRERHETRVLIAGGGVAALEALLALDALAGGRLTVELLAPERHFAYRPLTVGEPFGLVEPIRLPLAAVATEHRARIRAGTLAAVDADAHRARTGDGELLEYDLLLIAIGARSVTALPGAVTFRGRLGSGELQSVLRDALEGRVGRLAFAVPHVVKWPLALYELALLTAGYLAASDARHVELMVVTHEREPLGIFGRGASARMRALLDEAGVRLLTASAPATVTDGGLRLMGGDFVSADRVVALPRLEVPPLAGVPQLERGFIPTDDHQRVDGLDDVYAAGDATWYPLKQGGLAAQQADAAAEAIAAAAGTELTPKPFRPVLRGIVLTGSAPLHLRSDLETSEESVAAHPLWWPTAKLAGRYLAPYLAARHGGDDQADLRLDDLPPEQGRSGAEVDEDHAATIEMALAAADASARWHDYEAALRWLGAAERLSVVLPLGYAERRREWTRAMQAERARDAGVH